MAQKKEKNYYAILGVSYKATKKEIKQAYRNLARKYHPDVNQKMLDAEKLFKEISEAYSTLNDDSKRYLHDISLGLNKKPQQNQAKSQFKSTSQARQNSSNRKKTKSAESLQKTKNHKESISDLINNFMKNISSVNKAKEKTKSEKKPRFERDKEETKAKKLNIPAINGEDITFTIFLTSEEAKKGIVKKVNLLHSDPCLKCEGLGKVKNLNCKNCDGKGFIDTHKKLDVKIPLNIKNNAKVKISKEGNRGINGGENGDLILNIKVYNPASFEYEGLNVLSEIPVSPLEVILGTEIKVLTIDGFVDMKIPPLSQNMQKFRISKQGLPDKNNVRGDHFVTIKIEIPRDITEKEKALYKQIAVISKFNPREYVN